MVIFEIDFTTLDDQEITRTITSEDYYFAGLSDIEQWALAATIGIDMADRENMTMWTIRLIAN